MLSATATAAVGDSPRIIRVSAFFAIKVHNTFYLFPTPWILSGLRPSRMTAIKVSLSSPYIHSISFTDSPNIKRADDNWCRSLSDFITPQKKRGINATYPTVVRQNLYGINAKTHATRREPMHLSFPYFKNFADFCRKPRAKLKLMSKCYYSIKPLIIVYGINLT